MQGKLTAVASSLLILIMVAPSLVGAPSSSQPQVTSFPHLHLGFYAAEEGRNINRQVGQKLGTAIRNKEANFKLRDINRAPLFYQENGKDGVKVVGNRQFAIVGLEQVSSEQNESITYATGEQLASNLSQSLNLAQKKVKEIQCEPPPQVVGEKWSQTCGNNAYAVYIKLNYEETEVDSVGDKIVEGVKSYYQSYRKSVTDSAQKDESKYTEREVFLVPSDDWKTVLQLIPITTWTDQEGEVHRYPTLIYHQEDGNEVDLDSIVHFLKDYNPTRVTLVGQPQQETLDILGSTLGANLPADKLKIINESDLSDYWQTKKEIIYASDPTKDGFKQLPLRAAVQASMLHQPLAIEGSSLDRKKLLADKQVTCIGNNDPVCSRVKDRNELKWEQARKLKNKVVVTTPHPQGKKGQLTTETTRDEINQLGKRMSLVASILAASRQEFLIKCSNPDCVQNKIKTFGSYTENSPQIKISRKNKQNILYYNSSSGKTSRLLPFDAKKGKYEKHISGLDISGNKVAWKEEGGIFLKDIGGGKTQTILDMYQDGAPTEISSPFLSNKHLLWVEKYVSSSKKQPLPDINKYLVIYDQTKQKVVHKEEITLPFALSNWRQPISLHGGQAAWINGSGIVLFNISSKKKTFIYQKRAREGKYSSWARPLLSDNYLLVYKNPLRDSYSSLEKQKTTDKSDNPDPEDLPDFEEPNPEPLEPTTLQQDKIKIKFFKLNHLDVIRRPVREFSMKGSSSIRDCSLSDRGALCEVLGPKRNKINLSYFPTNDDGKRVLHQFNVPLECSTRKIGPDLDGCQGVWSIGKMYSGTDVYRSGKLYLENVCNPADGKKLIYGAGDDVGSRPKVSGRAAVWTATTPTSTTEKIKGTLTLVGTRKKLQEGTKKRKGPSGMAKTLSAWDASKYADFDDDGYPDTGIGRITGLTVSDASTLLARNLFYHQLQREKEVAFLGSSFPVCRQSAKAMADSFTQAGYEVTLKTSKKEHYEFSPGLWRNKNLIAYYDHGNKNWAGIPSQEIPPLANSQVFAGACSTCSTFNKESFCHRSIRQGNSFFFGAVSPALANGAAEAAFTNNFLDRIYHQQLPIGLAFAAEYSSNTEARSPFLLLGDPLLQIDPPYKFSKPLFQ